MSPLQQCSRHKPPSEYTTVYVQDHLGRRQVFCRTTRPHACGRNVFLPHPGPSSNFEVRLQPCMISSTPPPLPSTSIIFARAHTTTKTNITTTAAITPPPTDAPSGSSPRHQRLNWGPQAREARAASMKLTHSPTCPPTHPATPPHPTPPLPTHTHTPTHLT